MEQITQKLQSFLESAKSVNYDIVALYDKEPAVMQIIVGVVLLIVVIVGLMIKSSLKKSAANSALNALESYVENFDQYQNYWAKITKVLKNAKPEFLERLKENKEKFYDGQLATCEAMELPQKLTNCTKMSESYKELSHQTRDEELHAFYGEKSQEILDVEVPQFISEYMESFSFTPEDVVVLEEIVAFANAQTEERK